MSTPNQAPIHVPVEGISEQPTPIEVSLPEQAPLATSPADTFEGPGIISGLKATVRSLSRREGLEDANVLTGSRSNNAHNIARDAANGSPASIDNYVDQVVRVRARALRNSRQGRDFYRGKSDDKDSTSIL